MLVARGVMTYVDVDAQPEHPIKLMDGSSIPSPTTATITIRLDGASLKQSIGDMSGRRVRVMVEHID